MTKVIAKIVLLFTVVWIMVPTPSAGGQDANRPASEPNPGVVGKSPALHPGPAESLYLQLRSVGLDLARVYSVRDLSIERGGFHLSLDDGTIAFTQDVAGHVTGAFFEGEGEILLFPPDQAERASMLLFTGSTILEEKFGSAYFRFNDNTYAEVQSSLRSAENPQEFVTRWNEAARELAEGDALRLLVSFSSSVPGEGATPDPRAANAVAGEDRMLHARLQGRKLGTFDVYYDTNAAEQVWAGQSKIAGGVIFYDVWTSFSTPRRSATTAAISGTTAEAGNVDVIDVSHYTIRSEIHPPTELKAEATLQVGIRQGGERTLLFRLSRFLQVENIEADGKPVEFIHNQAVEGTQLARQGNDLVAVIFAEPLRAGQKLTLRFVYGGSVLSEAGSGLLYVGARGNWYPNRGLQMSNYDLEFHYPAIWTLVATGKRIETSGDALETTGTPSSEAFSHWVSERPIPIAGFNLGKYQRAVAQAGNTTVETYATAVVERGFPQGKTETVIPTNPSGSEGIQMVVPIAPPSPARHAQAVANTAARAIEAFSQWFGPYPYSSLALTQLPGSESQGWPGLIFLSSFLFLSSEEESQLNMSDVNKTLTNQVIAHETAHQWWGDLVGWSGYRDQWLVEALANYSSLMMLEREDPSKFHAALAKYKDDLLQRNENGVLLSDDGAVTLGTRLSNSQFPAGYDAISYGRGTWLFHMLRCMLRDAQRKELTGGAETSTPEDEPFLRALRKVRERYEGKPISTRELVRIFEEEMPASLSYEGRKSLDWFYQGWINGISIPRIELRGVKFLDKTANATTVNGTIVQRDAPKTLVTPVPLFASRAGRLEYLGRIFADGPETTFHLKVPAGTRKIIVDPYETLLTRSR